VGTAIRIVIGAPVLSFAFMWWCHVLRPADVRRGHKLAGALRLIRVCGPVHSGHRVADLLLVHGLTVPRQPPFLAGSQA
jgi:hypothetical protein